MIDEMVALLKDEQLADDHKRESCLGTLDQTADKKKGLEATISDTEAAIATTEEAIAATKEQIAALERGIRALDKQVVEATEQRKAESEEFAELMATDTAAK